MSKELQLQCSHQDKTDNNDDKTKVFVTKTPLLDLYHISSIEACKVSYITPNIPYQR